MARRTVPKEWEEQVAALGPSARALIEAVAAIPPIRVIPCPACGRELGREEATPGGRAPSAIFPAADLIPAPTRDSGRLAFVPMGRTRRSRNPDGRRDAIPPLSLTCRCGGRAIVDNLTPATDNP